MIGLAYKKLETITLLRRCSLCTDDSIMTIAAEALRLSENSKELFAELLPEKMRLWGKRYPNAGYGGTFIHWLSDETMGAYGSYGNGSGMRVSPCGLVATSLDEALGLAKISAEVTHNHLESIKGARAVATCIFLAKNGKSKEEIRAYVENNFYNLSKTIDDIRLFYIMDVSCQGSVPVAIRAFFEGTDFEDVIRTAVSVGGDSDTICDMDGAIAWSYYKAKNHGELTKDMVYMKEVREAVGRFEEYMQSVK